MGAGNSFHGTLFIYFFKRPFNPPQGLEMLKMSSFRYYARLTFSSAFEVMFFLCLQGGVETCRQTLTVRFLRTTRHLQGIKTDKISWHLSFAGRIKGANGASENSIRILRERKIGWRRYVLRARSMMICGSVNTIGIIID
jgi:hypothetical protein